MKEKPDKPWGGRFEEGTDPVVEGFTSSLRFDKRLFTYDIEGSIAHAKMLNSVGLMTEEEFDSLILGLEEIRKEIEEGRFTFNESLEDIHMNIESRLIERWGPAGRKLHTARSRNDQVALDVRLFLKEEIKGILGLLRSLQEALVVCARAHLHVTMPGYTHLQRAQPVLLAHHLMAYYEMCKRDRDRLMDCLKRVDVMPLGSGALSGSGLPLDRALVARELGFSEISANSMDAVGDRDFILEFLAASSILMMHLSRLAEEVILWATKEFDFIELPDSLCTGSSLMPQKKNPDPMELVRGKTGRVYGNLISLLVTMKALPLTYNRDLQEDKEPLFDTADTLRGALSVMTLCIKRMKVKEERMRDALKSGFLEATDLAEYLVKKGVPFRQAHHIVGELVGEAVRRGLSNLSSFTIDELKGYWDGFDKEAIPYIDPEKAVARKGIRGGTAPVMVEDAIKSAEKELTHNE